MKFEFDKPTSDMDVMTGVDIHLKDGSIDSYDPVVCLAIQDDFVEINTGFYTYNIALKEIYEIILLKRTPYYDKDIDVIWYKDSDYETIWESEDE